MQQSKLALEWVRFSVNAKKMHSMGEKCVLTASSLSNTRLDYTECFNNLVDKNGENYDILAYQAIVFSMGKRVQLQPIVI